MALSAAMQQRYTTEVDIDWWEALILSHSAAGTYYLTNDHQVQYGNFNGEKRLFQPIPFEVVLPTLDGEGQQDLQIRICNVGEEMLKALDKVRQRPEEPIRCQATAFIKGNLDPQYDPPWDLTLTDIELNREVFSGTATRTDVFNMRFPRQLYRPDRYPALVRR
jgi:hypothetical protein